MSEKHSENVKLTLIIIFSMLTKQELSEGDRMSRHMMEVFQDYLVRQGLRLTRQRELIAGTFFRHKGHISTEELHHQVQKIDAGIGYATVYRTIKLLSRAGLAAQRSFGECFARYEPAMETGHHDHLICTECGRIVEFANDRIESLQQAVAIEHDFRVTDHKLELYGICKECKEHSG